MQLLLPFVWWHVAKGIAITASLSVGTESAEKIVVTKVKAHARLVTAVSLSPDGKRFLTASQDKTVCVWDCESMSKSVTYKLDSTVMSAAFHPTKPFFACGCGDGSIRLWDLETGKQTKSLKGHSDSVRILLFDTKGDLLISGSDDFTIRVWDMKSTACLRNLDLHKDSVTCLALAGTNLISGSLDGSVRVWESIGEGKVTEYQWIKDGVLAILVLEKGEQLAVTGKNDHIDIYKLPNGVLSAGHNGLRNYIYSMLYHSATDTIFAGDCEGSLAIVTRKTGKVVAAVSQKSGISCMCWLTGSRAIAGCEDGMLLIIDYPKVK